MLKRPLQMKTSITQPVGFKMKLKQLLGSIYDEIRIDLDTIHLIGLECNKYPAHKALALHGGSTPLLL